MHMQYGPLILPLAALGAVFAAPTLAATPVHLQILRLRALHSVWPAPAPGADSLSVNWGGGTLGGRSWPKRPA